MAPIVAVHLATVLPAFLIGTWLIFLSRKGARWHRALGAVYLGLMFVTAIVTLFIREVNDGRPSWIHYVFIPLTLFAIYGALSGVRAGSIRRHKYAMIGLYIGIIGARTAALLPGRIMFRVLFG
jgi:uncharacterized membrane protein